MAHGIGKAEAKLTPWTVVRERGSILPLDELGQWLRNGWIESQRIS
jgi:hypothetical protein